MNARDRSHDPVGRHDELTTLEQRFLFYGVHADAAAIARVLMSAPLVGDGSGFGDRPGREIAGSGAGPIGVLPDTRVRLRRHHFAARTDSLRRPIRSA